MARRSVMGKRLGLLVGGVLPAALLAGCDTAPPASSGTPAASAPANAPPPPAPTAAGGQETAKPAPSQSPPAGEDAAADFKLTLPPFDVSGMPQPVRMSYSELKRGVESKKAPLNEALTIAALHYVHGSAADAVKIVSQVCAAQPNHVLSRHMLGLCQEKAGAADEALRTYEKVVQLDPKFGAGYMRIGVLLIEKDRARAKAAFEKAIELQPNDARPYLGIAKILKAEGKNQEAYARCLEAVERYPAYAEAQKDAAELSAALGKPKESEQHKLRAAQGGLPPNADPMLDRILLIGLDLRRVIQEGLALAELGETARAEELLMKAIPLDMQGTTAQRAMASFRVTTGKLDQAASLLRAVLEANPQDASAMYQLADVLTRQGRSAEALEQFNKVAQLAPNDPRVPFMIGNVHYTAGKLDEAKKSWLRALEIAPAYEDPYVRLGELASKQKDYPEYVRILKEGLERVPNSALLANGLAWVYATSPDEKFRNGAEAVKLAERAVKATNSRMHQMIDTLACAYAEAGRFEEAVKSIDEAANMASDPSQKVFLDQYKIRQKLFREKKPFRDS